MFRKRKGKRPQDPRRAELIGVVRSADAIPAKMKTVALLAVTRMPIEQVGELLVLSKELIPLAEAGDRNGIEGVLLKFGISPGIVETALSHYDDIAPKVDK